MIKTARPIGLAFVFAVLAACVNVDPQTGETKPRGNQKYKYSYVTERADQLRPGMSKLQVLVLLGSPAEKDAAGDTWVYLPERSGILIPATALKVTFKFDELESHSYHPIVLGQKL